jgi:hypothetical protein
MVPVSIHVDEGLFARFGKFKVSSRRAVSRSLGITRYEAIRLQTGENRVDIAFTNHQTVRLLEGLCHLIAVTLAVPQQIQDDDVQQALPQLSLPVVQIQNAPLFQTAYDFEFFIQYTTKQYTGKSKQKFYFF